METVKLWRPVGIKELLLIEASGWKKFPPRLSWQPIFYPVLNYDYAAQIAKEWNSNSKDSGYAGFVTCFEIAKDYFEKFEIQNVGGHMHNELWVPAEKLEIFNTRLLNGIHVVDAFYGEKFEGEKLILPVRISE